jgi:predicted nucleic acid-binding protein
MAVLIVDASVVIEYLIDDAHTPNARVFFAHSAQRDELIVPEFCLLECTNVLWKQARFQNMSVLQAEALLRHMKKLPLTRVPVKRLLKSSLTIALTHQLAVYDSAYIALAIRSNCPLVTLDQPQMRAARAEGVTVVSLNDVQI